MVRVYAIGTTASLYEKHLNPGGSWSTSWYNLGGAVTGAPTAMVDHSGTVRVFARGTNAALGRTKRRAPASRCRAPGADARSLIEPGVRKGL